MQNLARILMVDDVTRYQKIYELAITEAVAATVDFATDGIEALDKIHNSDPYDLMILDLNMPNLGGEETLIQIRKKIEFNHMPIIILTGEAQYNTEERLLEIGADDFIEKGSEPEIFVARLKAQLRYKASIDALEQLARDTDIFATGVLHDIRTLEKTTLDICEHTNKLIEMSPTQHKEDILKNMKLLDSQASKISQYASDIIKTIRETKTKIELNQLSLDDILTWAKSILAPQIPHKPDLFKLQLNSEFDDVQADAKLLKLVIFNILQFFIKQNQKSIPLISIFQEESNKSHHTFSFSSNNPHHDSHDSLPTQLSLANKAILAIEGSLNICQKANKISISLLKA